MDGRRTAKRSARPEAAEDPSARIPRTRNWGRVRSTVPSATSTRFDSQAATRPYDPSTRGGAAVAGSVAWSDRVFRPGTAPVEGGVVTDTSTIIQLEPLTTCGPDHIPGCRSGPAVR